MRPAGALLALLGLYLALALWVAAWRRRSEATRGVPLWAAAWGIWAIAAGARWLPPRPTHALAGAAAWLIASLLLVQAGAALSRRLSPRAWLWLLGPGQALAMAGTWLTDWRMHRQRVRQREALDEAAAKSAAAPTPAESRDGEALESVVELGETAVREVMVPRGEIQALPESARVRDWARLAEASRHGNLPVYRSDLDEILGYVALEDLFRATQPDVPVTRFLRDARFVPETMRCDDLLRDLIAHDERIAIVVDEFGGTAGLVRERDLFEILLGEIDREEAGGVGLRSIEPGVYLADGSCRIDDFNEASPGALPEGEYETLAGLVLQRLGRIPAAGESLVADGVRIEVVVASERRILKLRVTLPGTGATEPGGGPRGDC